MAVKRKPKPLFFVVLVGFLGIILLTIGGVFIYFSTPVDKNDENVIEVVIPQGTTTKKIGSILKEKDLIKSELYFSLYTRFFNHNSLKASTYKLTKSMSLADIVTSLEKGSTYDPDALVLTFKEGKRITDYVKLIANNTSYSEDEIIELINDKTYLNDLISKYWFLTSDILNKDIYYPLEGYLAPDTYFFNKDVDVKKIIETLLDVTLQAAQWCFATTTNYRDCVIAAVNLGSDTDTTACVAGALAGAAYGFDAIPPEWIDALRGKDVLESTLF